MDRDHPIARQSNIWYPNQSNPSPIRPNLSTKYFWTRKCKNWIVSFRFTN